MIFGWCAVEVISERTKMQERCIPQDLAKVVLHGNDCCRFFTTGIPSFGVPEQHVLKDIFELLSGGRFNLSTLV